MSETNVYEEEQVEMAYEEDQEAKKLHRVVVTLNKKQNKKNVQHVFDDVTLFSPFGGEACVIETTTVTVVFPMSHVQTVAMVEMPPKEEVLQPQIIRPTVMKENDDS